VICHFLSFIFIFYTFKIGLQKYKIFYSTKPFSEKLFS